VDADDVESPRAHVLELVRRLWAYDCDVAGTRLDVFAVRSDPRSSAPDDPRLGVGMPVQIGPLTGLVVDQEERDTRAMGLPFERNRGCAAARPLESPGTCPSFPSVFWGDSTLTRKA
jgi:hypothetical protein